MSILVLSTDDDAARSLCSALTRTGQIALWERAPEQARTTARDRQPLVLVADTCVDGHDQVIDELRDITPWARVYLMADPAAPFPRALAPVVQKPFDAAELAALLVRERELAELERGRRNLQAHVDELGVLVEACFEAIVGLGPDGTIRSWNRGAEATYGYAAEEIIGRPITVLEVDQAAAEARLESASHAVREVTRRRKDGHEVRVLVSQSPVRASDTSLGFAEVSLDVTERKDLERELEHAERLAAIGRLAASMAHEINNPLSVIRASTSYIAEVAEKIGDQELAESARDMELASERIGSFVQHVCGFARRERPQLSDASVSETLDIALRMARPRARDRGVAVRVEPVGDVRVPHDPPRLAQAILNVIANAIDAAADGGREISVEVASDHDHVHIRVDDTGRGVASEIRGHLFEPFATTKPAGQGTGLGLAITRQILQDHGGTVTLDPRDDGGMRAELSVPSLDLSAHRILVLDDDPSVRRALATELRREGFSVLTARTLSEALDALAREPTRVVLTDVRLSDAEGAEICKQLRQASPGVRCMVVSGDADRGDTGADATATKPWNRGELIARVRELYIEQ